MPLAIGFFDGPSLVFEENGRADRRRAQETWLYGAQASEPQVGVTRNQYVGVRQEIGEPMAVSLWLPLKPTWKGYPQKHSPVCLVDCCDRWSKLGSRETSSKTRIMRKDQVDDGQSSFEMDLTAALKLTGAEIHRFGCPDCLDLPSSNSSPCKRTPKPKKIQTNSHSRP